MKRENKSTVDWITHGVIDEGIMPGMIDAHSHGLNKYGSRDKYLMHLYERIEDSLIHNRNKTHHIKNKKFKLILSYVRKALERVDINDIKEFYNTLSKYDDDINICTNCEYYDYKDENHSCWHKQCKYDSDYEVNVFDETTDLVIPTTWLYLNPSEDPLNMKCGVLLEFYDEIKPGWSDSDNPVSFYIRFGEYGLQVFRLDSTIIKYWGCRED